MHGHIKTLLQMKIVLERKGKQMDIELIRQTTFRIAQCDKVMKALGNLAPRCAADEVCICIMRLCLWLIFYSLHQAN
jgi:hypothetical protein